ncbi:lipopolysaccharide biosynthesis protein [Bacteroides caecimuris]|uniref:lipopolysaccharide biosynthesis protein n=1 Tax=Bacteroides caecimuris TaxID=1796613 RepID=UPI00265C9B52|nr:lipopolysaccharide biosynthesis protein [Bacteroides caecimuris]
MNIGRSLIIKSLLWKYFERLGAQIISFVVSVLLARLLTPDHYGAIALIMIFINVCNVIIDGGLNTALIQKKQADDLDFSTILYSSLLISALLYCILFFAAPYIAEFYAVPILSKVIRIIGINLIFYALNSVQRAYVSKHMMFNVLFYSSFIAVLLSGLIGILLAYNGAGIWALVAQNMSCVIITSIVMWFTIKWRPSLMFSIDRFWGLFRYGWKILMANFITVMFVEVRKLCIGKIYSTSNLAYYEKGEQFPSLVMNNIFTSIQTILLPTFSEYQEDKAKIKSMMRRATKMSCFVIYPLMVGMIVTAGPLVHMLLGDKWSGAVPFIQIMCVANFFRPITISNWEAIKALGYSDITLKLEVLKKIIDIIILLITIKIGVTAVAWGVVLFNFICIFINLFPNIKLLNYKIKEQILDAIPTFLISILMGVVIYFLRGLDISNIWLFIIQVIMGIMTYIGFCRLFKEESMMFLLDLLKQSIQKKKSQL